MFGAMFVGEYTVYNSSMQHKGAFTITIKRY